MSRRLAILVSVALGALVAAGPAAADAQVRITLFGFDPAVVTVQPGEAIHWANDTFLPQSVTSGRGLFDSGLIPPGGGFSMAIHIPGAHGYASSENPLFDGAIRVRPQQLPGEQDDLAADAIPDLTFPEVAENEVQTHPLLAVDASTSRILLGVKPNATVGQVNAALAGVDAQIAGGLPSLGILLIQVAEQPTWTSSAPDLGGFTGLAAALDHLRQSTAFEFVSMSTAVQSNALPRPPEDEGVPGVWSWDDTGMANWGLKDARFPAAWNLRESIARTKPTVVTGVFEQAFDQHPDFKQAPGLPSLLDIRTRLCPPGGTCVATVNGSEEKPRKHGAHVVGIIGAAWDNPAQPEPPVSAKSFGISGGNPFARVVGVPGSDLAATTERVAGGWTWDRLLERFTAFLRARPADLRVINYSGAASSFSAARWADNFAPKRCGPGATDDDLPEIQVDAKYFCTPNSLDAWLREWANVGKAARRLAVEAARSNVMIVQSAGNDSDAFCVPWTAPGCRPVKIAAANANEFAWASQHWVGDDNPIIVVEAAGQDGKVAAFSNVGGTIAAPGVDITSTVTHGNYEAMDGTSQAAPHVTAAVGYLLAANPTLSLDEIRKRLLTWGRRPPPADTEPATRFTWTVPDRFGRDDDGDRLVDYPSSDESAAPSYPVELFACGRTAQGLAPVSYEWTLDGQTFTTDACTFRHEFGSEGPHEVRLVMTNEYGRTVSAQETLVVQDWLVASVGDAIGSGDGAPDVERSPPFEQSTWQETRCHRSANAGSAQVSRWLELADVQTSVTFVHLACSGARIRGDLDEQGNPVDGADGEGGLLTPYRGIEAEEPALDPQLNQLRPAIGSRDLDALTVSVGAEDLRFTQILKDCLTPLTDCDTGQGKDIYDARIVQLPGRFDELAAKLDGLGIPDSRVLITPYPDLTRASALSEVKDLSCIPGAPVSQAEADWLSDVVIAGLNAAVADAAVRHGWTLVDGTAAAFRGHGYCSADPWFVRVGAGELRKFLEDNPVYAGAFQPNVAGHGAVARRFFEKLKPALSLPDGVSVARPFWDSPRLDAFSSLLADKDSAKRLVDVNDPSPDGNRRVITERGPGGTVVEKPDTRLSRYAGESSSPDGFVDLRDFRRFRDAWLAGCVDVPEAQRDSACPAPESIQLDGAPGHPKKDLNFDRCVFLVGDTAGCQVGEQRYSRFDFNGDGQVSLEGVMFLPLRPDGTPAAELRDATHLTDLDILKSQWSPQPGASEGWGAEDLARLLHSADLEIHLENVLGVGVTAAQVQVQHPGGSDVGPERIVKKSAGFAIVTVPLSSPTEEFEVVAVAQTPKGAVRVASGPFTLRYGEDKRIDFTSGRSALNATPERVTANGSSKSKVTMSVTGGGSGPIAAKTSAQAADGFPVTWSVSPAAGAQLDGAETVTDEAGEAEAEFVATEPGTYTIRTLVDLGDEVTVAETEVVAAPAVTVRYLWRQEILEFSEEGSTKWDMPDRPDCRDIEELDYCYDDSRVEIDSAGTGNPPLFRSGTLRGGVDSFTVTQTVFSDADGDPVPPGYARQRLAWTRTDKDTGDSVQGGATTEHSIFDPGAYATPKPIDGLSVDETIDGISVAGMQAVGDLPYHYDVFGNVPREFGGLPIGFMLLGKPADVWFATAPENELEFRRTEVGYEPFHSCGKWELDLENEPGYLLEETGDEYIGTVRSRTPTYTPGALPMPAGPKRILVRYSFAATVGADGAVPDEPELPDCSIDHPPTADFEWSPAEAHEGRQVHFLDRSTDPDNDIVKWEWKTSDVSPADRLVPWKTESQEKNPYFSFLDDGTATVTLTVTDTSGATDTVEKQVPLADLPPYVQLYDATAQAGQPVKVTFRALDPGDTDKREIDIRITSDNPDWRTVENTLHKGGVVRVTNSELPVGTYSLVITAKTKDGEVEGEAELAVTETPPEPAPPPSSATFASCDPAVVLDAEEREFVDRVNEYRADNGLDPVRISPALTVASVAHAHDMAVNDFMDHTGSDGSSPTDRAVRAGYPAEGAVGENVAEAENALNATWVWRGSTTGHNENMLDPKWKAIGIAREKGRIERWATSYGDILDCGAPTPPPASPDESAPGTTRATASPMPITTAPGRSLSAAAADEASTAPIFPPTAAITISDATPREGTPVIFTNRSRDTSGTPIAATLFLDPPVQIALGPGESTSHAYAAAGSHTARLTASSESEVARVLVVAPKLPLALTYLGPTTAFTPGSLAATARADSATTSTPVAGAELTFRFEGESKTATTISNGLASAGFPVPAAPGRYEVTVQFAGNADYLPAQTSAFVDVLTNAAPIADAGGPYTVGEGQTLVLDGSRSREPDAGDRVNKWEWELDGDQDFDDARGPTPAGIVWGALQTGLCGGACVTGQDYPISLRVSDTRGGRHTTSTAVRFTADFAVVIAGGTFTVVPSASNSFGVTVVGSSTWTHPVTLAVEGLPAGITGSFSRNPVTPTGTSVLTLTAGANAPSGSFPITITGTGNGITRTAGSEVEVKFGLVPKCYGAFAGTVTDRDTGEPLESVGVYLFGVFKPDAVTDENGRYVLNDVELGFNNAPVTRAPRALYPGYWDVQKLAEAACGVVTQVDYQLRLKRTGRVSGRVVDKDTRTPIAGANATFTSGFSTVSLTADSDGRFATDLELGRENVPNTYSATATAAEYWAQHTSVTATAETEATVGFELVRKCYAAIGGGVVHRQGTSIPVANAQVQLYGGDLNVYTTTNAQGVFRFDRQVPLGQNNQQITYTLAVSPPPGSPSGSQGSFQLKQIKDCGETADGFELTVYIPTSNFGSIDGYVLDEETNEPIANAGVALFGLGSGTTDATGYYRIDGVFIGFDAVTTRSIIISAWKAAYHDTSVTRNIVANATTRVDLLLLRKRFGTAAGTVKDSISGAPIPGATTTFMTTDRDGHYAGTVSLGFRNAPVTTSVTADAPGYWRQAKTATYRADETTTVDFELIRECAAARVTGTVVNALTQEPIPNAFVQTSTGGGVLTNAQGRFELTGLRAAVNNEPVTMTLTASAPGFNFAQKQISIFCGATIVVDFGSGSALGTIVGTVTNLDTGQPVAGAFVGAEFGAYATTDASGGFRFTSVPLGAGNADREWKLTATLAGFRPMTKAVVAKANEERRVDFGFTKAGNHKPTAAPGTYELPEDPGSSQIPPLTLTGADQDGDSLTYHVMRHPLHGVVRGFPPNLDYVPFSNYNGPDSFEFVTFDGQDFSERATVEITVRPVNDAPRATADSFERPAGVPARIPIAEILANDTDVDGDVLAIHSATPFFPATAFIDGGDLVVSAPPGEARVLYYINDGHGALASANITIRFVEVPLAPACGAATFSGPQDEPLAGRVTCTDANGDTLTYTLVGGPDAGVLDLRADGTFTYNPPAGFVGTKTFTFRASDGALQSPTATATLVITGSNRAPVAESSAASTPEDTAVELVFGATDADGDLLSFDVVAGPTYGTLVGRRYTPSANYHGLDTVRFRASDGQLSSEAVVSITVTPANDPPSAVDATLNGTVGVPLTIDLGARSCRPSAR